ncbi:hypothetical protein [Alicyclobacillus sp. SO9]|uniref:hypothetical protein n=1 Tax=Alicyclobacillus sp. SO9 TaxID=2665646 RepID=UPI0018E8C2DB|nr:hypothetical protein [Alicyclobacillus sp. SO9]QQE78794.1 hypothetical protein GI364_23610 [Alicyclobacillus sp. SO9]
MKIWKDKQWRINILFGLPFVLIGLTVLGWNVYQRSLFTFSHPTSVYITRQRHGKFKPLNVTVKDVDIVQKMYAGLKVFKAFPRGSVSCPADFGIEYTLTFESGNKNLVTAHVDPNGCEEIRLSTGQHLTGATNNPKANIFWSSLASALHLPDQSYLGGATP